jgi:hypothetical protein
MFIFKFFTRHYFLILQAVTIPPLEEEVYLQIAQAYQIQLTDINLFLVISLVMEIQLMEQIH